jgi:hypothetical protein
MADVKTIWWFFWKTWYCILVCSPLILWVMIYQLMPRAKKVLMLARQHFL